MDKIRLGFIGVSNRGRCNMHLCARMPDVKITAVCDLYLDRALLAEDECQILHGYKPFYTTDYKELIKSGLVDFNVINKLSTEESIKYLCEVKGIGPKVASCALLFAFEKYDAFPIDVWIKKVIAKYFDSENPDKFVSQSLGEYAGIAQQFLFYYERYGGYKMYN